MFSPTLLILSHIINQWWFFLSVFFSQQHLPIPNWWEKDSIGYFSLHHRNEGPPKSRSKFSLHLNRGKALSASSFTFFDLFSLFSLGVTHSLSASLDHASNYVSVLFWILLLGFCFWLVSKSTSPDGEWKWGEKGTLMVRMEPHTPLTGEQSRKSANESWNRRKVFHINYILTSIKHHLLGKAGFSIFMLDDKLFEIYIVHERVKFMKLHSVEVGGSLEINSEFSIILLLTLSTLPTSPCDHLQLREER